MKYRIGNTVINADHIVNVFFEPSSSGIDDETGKPYNLSAKCLITLTSVHLGIKDDYEGRIEGVSSESDAIELHGKNAELFWSYYSGDAVEVY